MHTVRERIEEIERGAVRQAEGLLLNAVRECWSASDIADAARYWDRAKQRLEDAQTWRERVGGTFDFNGVEWGKYKDDPFRLDADASPVKIKNKRG